MREIAVFQMRHRAVLPRCVAKMLSHPKKMLVMSRSFREEVGISPL